MYDLSLLFSNKTGYGVVSLDKEELNAEEAVYITSLQDKKKKKKKIKACNLFSLSLEDLKCLVYILYLETNAMIQCHTKWNCSLKPRSTRGWCVINSESVQSIGSGGCYNHEENTALKTTMKISVRHRFLHGKTKMVTGFLLLKTTL